MKKWTRKYSINNRVLHDSWFATNRKSDYVHLHRGSRTRGFKLLSRRFPHRLDMPRLRQKRNSNNRRRPRRVTNPYLRPVRLPSKKIILWKSMSGTAGKWYYNITLSDLIAAYVGTYDEFRVVNLRITYKPDNSTSADGLCAGVLMDQKGFGAYGSAGETAWFQTLGSMPGSKIRPRFVTTTYAWRPTEPDSRQWRSYQRSETSYTVATFYMADDGKESAEYGGILEISGLVLGRGRYYNAPTIRSLEGCSKSCGCCLKQLSM